MHAVLGFARQARQSEEQKQVDIDQIIRRDHNIQYIDDYCEAVSSNYHLFKDGEVDFQTFKMIIQSLPEEPVIKEQNYFEDYLEDRRKQDEQVVSNNLQVEGLRSSRQPQQVPIKQTGVGGSNLQRPADLPTQGVDGRSRVGASILPYNQTSHVNHQTSNIAGIPGNRNQPNPSQLFPIGPAYSSNGANFRTDNRDQASNQNSMVHSINLQSIRSPGSPRAREVDSIHLRTVHNDQLLRDRLSPRA